jgi:hypothetical protein
MKTILPLLLSLALAGCAIETAPAAPDPFAQLQKGLTAAQVRDLAGEPLEIKPFHADVVASEIWVYRRKLSESEQQVQVGSRAVPLTNPLTGQTENSSEPIFETQTITITETIELLMIESRLTEWKRRQQAEPRITFR